MRMGYCKELEQDGISPESAQIIVRTFLYYYLSPEQHSVADCINYTRNWLKQGGRGLLEEFELAAHRLADLFK